MAKYNKEIVKRICSLIIEDSFTIAEICTQVGINQDTYFDWVKRKPEFSEAIKKAKDSFNDLLIVEAKKSLMKKIRGYTIQEKKTVTGDSGKKDEVTGKPIVKVKEHTVIEKHIQPDTAAIIFTLVNRDPDNWRNKMDNTITGDITLKSELDKLSDEELERIIQDGDKQNGQDSESDKA
jgi:transposase-like protein